jgi:hypothetical protein
MMRRFFTFACSIGLLAAAQTCFASAGHWIPAAWNTRDFFVPEVPGLYGAIYAPYYAVHGIKDNNGNLVTSLTANTPSGPVKVDVSITADAINAAPSLIYAPGWEVLGGRCGFIAALSVGNRNVSSQFETESGLGLTSSVRNFGIGDLMVEPVWLDWSLPGWDAAFAYAFHAPTGKYGVESRTFPIGGGIKVTAPSPENVGLGMWTHQFHQSLAWYPSGGKETIAAITLTEQFNSKKRSLDVTPGADVSLNWGLSHYLPLKGNDRVLDVGPTGYFFWQVTGDSGSQVINPNARTRISAAGVQIAYKDFPAGITIGFRYVNEFAAKSWLDGQWISLNVGKKLF